MVKTAITLPQDLFEVVLRLASERGVSRSSLVVEALRDYASRLEAEELTRSWNEVLAKMTEEEKQADLDFLHAAAKAAIARMDNEDGGWPQPDGQTG
jgi:metal-responsive CopG/Arc/MetJ family transcriptional regulator